MFLNVFPIHRPYFLVSHTFVNQTWVNWKPTLLALASVITKFEFGLLNISTPIRIYYNSAVLPVACRSPVSRIRRRLSTRVPKYATCHFSDMARPLAFIGCLEPWRKCDARVYIDRMLEIKCSAPTNAGKHVTSSIACACSQ